MLGERLGRGLYELHENLIQAKFTRERKSLLGKTGLVGRKTRTPCRDIFDDSLTI